MARNCGSCAERVRCSACPNATTEDRSRTPIVKGLRLYNYYDCKWGTVAETPDSEGWFRFNHEDGTNALLNGVRVSLVKP